MAGHGRSKLARLSILNELRANTETHYSDVEHSSLDQSENSICILRELRANTETHDSDKQILFGSIREQHMYP
jgi:hypothetical protein